MATRIRLARGGSKKRPFYRIVVADSRAPRDGKFIEKIGTYNPLVQKGDAQRVVLNTERAKHWLSVGAVPSERILSFFNEAKLGQEYAAVKHLNAKHEKRVALKATEIAERKKAEAKAKAEAEAEAAKQAEVEAAPAEAEEAKEEAAADETSADETKEPEEASA